MGSLISKIQELEEEREFERKVQRFEKFKQDLKSQIDTMSMEEAVDVEWVLKNKNKILNNRELIRLLYGG